MANGWAGDVLLIGNNGDWTHVTEDHGYITQPHTTGESSLCEGCVYASIG